MLVMSSFWPTTVEGWVGLIILICSLVAAIAGLVPTGIKLYRTLKQLVKDKNWKKIIQFASAAMKQAEASGKKAKEKKIIVIESVVAACKEIGVEIDEKQLKDLSDYIDELIKWHNDMNEAEGE